MIYQLSEEAYDFLAKRKHPLLFDSRTSEEFRIAVESQHIPIVQKWYNAMYTIFGDPHCDNTLTVEDMKDLINVFDKWEIDKEFID